MNGIVFHIVSGHAFFTGIALICVAAFASIQTRPFFKRLTVLCFLSGVIAVVVSSTAIPYWYYTVASITTLVWIGSRFKKGWRRPAAYAVIAAWCGAAALEIPFHVIRSLEPTSLRSITVIGDSVTAGIGGEDTAETWTGILAREHNLDVVDVSHVGETAASALKRVQQQEIATPVVLAEIGGNDLLGSTSSAQFAVDLNALLTHLAAPERQIVMFELPLLPFRHEYGRIQRSLSASHDVILVPKRVFLSVIAGGDSTLDSIHLSQAGHERMAECVWGLVESAFGSSP